MIIPKANPGSRVIYVCHPYSNDPDGNVRSIRRWCQWIAMRGEVPLAPQLFLPQYIDETHQREVAMAHCLALIEHCDEMYVFYPQNAWYDFRCSPGQQAEIERARELWGDQARIHHVWGQPYGEFAGTVAPLAEAGAIQAVPAPSGGETVAVAASEEACGVEVVMQLGIAPTRTQYVSSDIPWVWFDVNAVQVSTEPRTLVALGVSVAGVRRGAHDALIEAFVDGCLTLEGTDPNRHCILRRIVDGVDEVMLLLPEAIVVRAKRGSDPALLFSELDLVTVSPVAG